MKFEMNDREWIIKEVEQNELCSAHNDFSGDGCYYGTTFPSIQEIWLYKDIKKETKEKTLYHELMHCYLYSFISFNNSTCQLFMRYKRKNLKWYKKIWNYITGHKDRNWQWVPVGKVGE